MMINNPHTTLLKVLVINIFCDMSSGPSYHIGGRVAIPYISGKNGQVIYTHHLAHCQVLSIVQWRVALDTFARVA